MFFELLRYTYLQNALIAGSFVAVIAAIVGYFLLIRGLTFAGHALSHIGFAGAAGAVLLGIEPLFGMLAFTITSGMGISLLGKELRERDISIGIIMTIALSFGLLFLSLHRGFAERVYSILFGTILGINTLLVNTTIIFTFITLILLTLLFRPLLFSSFDPEQAQARGLPVRLIGIIFMVTVAISISIAVQIIGVLMIFTLLVGPAATAIRLTHRPGQTIILAVILSLFYTWTGIILAELTFLPVTFFIAALSFGFYLPARLLTNKQNHRLIATQSEDISHTDTTFKAVHEHIHVH